MVRKVCSYRVRKVPLKSPFGLIKKEIDFYYYYFLPKTSSPHPNN
jgi:hypothetical protein